MLNCSLLAKEARNWLLHSVQLYLPRLFVAVEAGWGWGPHSTMGDKAQLTVCDDTQVIPPQVSSDTCQFHSGRSGDGRERAGPPDPAP